MRPSPSGRKLPLGLENVKIVPRTAVFCSKVDIRLNILKRSAIDPIADIQNDVVARILVANGW